MIVAAVNPNPLCDCSYGEFAASPSLTTASRRASPGGRDQKARKLQERLLSAAQESFQAGYGTNLTVIEQQTYLAQAQTTEVVANAAWSKATVQLDHVTGQMLNRTGISLNNGQAKQPPKASNPRRLWR